MIILEKFKSHLISKKNKPSKVTIKNYLSDVRKFILWCENQSPAGFNPKKITNETINVYKACLNEKEIPSSSIERYLSSLRKFFNFLMQENLANSNPFDRAISTKQLPKNFLLLDAFKIHLFSENKSRLTVKNYLADIRQFLAWMEKSEEVNELVINEYKDILLYQSHLSPLSITRKLSSLRKYLGWIQKKNIKKASPNKTIMTTGLNTINKFELFKRIEDENNQKILENKNNFINIINTISDLIITLPIVKLLEKSEFFIWKMKGAEIFTPTQDKSLPRHKKIYFQLLHTRPKWYKKYHSYPIAHYLHISLLIIFATASGSAIYYSFYGNSPQQKTVFASPPWIRPKILAFQGKLSDSNNNPITAVTPLRFALYNSQSSSGSALLWQEVQAINPDADGIFKAQIGQKNPISSSLFSDNPALYLGMTVGSDKELQPRQELATASYSNDAQQLQGLIPITKDNAGTSNVILALDSAGNLTIGGKATPTFEASGGQFTISGKSLLFTSVAGSDGNIEIAPDGNGIIDLQKPIRNTTNNNNINSAQGAVEIDDSLAILATSSGQSAFTINQNSTGPLISASTSGIAMFTLENDGTGTFANNLILNGDHLTSGNTSFNLLNTDTINLNIGNSATSISLGANVGSTTINNKLITNSAYIDNLYTDNLIVAGTTTESAKFKIFGSGTNAGTASTSGQLTFTNSSQVNLLNNANLGFYNSLAGDAGINSANPTLYLAASGNIGIGTNNPTAKLQVNGDIRGQTIYASTTQLQQADLAENYISSQSLEAGDIIMPEGKDNNLAVIKTTKPYESRAIGIVSTQPGIILNSFAAADSSHPYVIPIAISGRVPVKVTTENGPIQVGDYLSASGIPGVAMKATGKGTTIGKALEDYTNPDPSTIGKILAYSSISTGYYETYNPQDNTNSFSGFIQTLTLQAQKTLTDSLSVTTENITIGGQTLKEYVTEIVRNSLQKEVEKEMAKYQIPNTKYPPSDLLSPLASESALPSNSPSIALAKEEARALEGTPSATYITNVTNIYNTLTASNSALLSNSTALSSASMDSSIASNSASTNTSIASNSAKPDADLYMAWPNASRSATIDPNSALQNTQITNDYANLSSLSGLLAYTPGLNTLPALQVLGASTLSDVAIVGNLNVGGSLILANNAINTLGSDLELQPLRQGNLSVMGGLLNIDTNGNLKVGGNATFAKDLTVKGKLTAGIIAPVPDSDLVIQLGNQKMPDSESVIRNSEFVIRNASGSAVLAVNQLGDIHASGSGSFTSLAAKSFTIVRGAQADTSLVQTIASSSAGTAIITTHETERTIISPFVTKDSLIYLTATSDTQGFTPYIARQTEKDFTIAIPYAVNKDIRVNWWIVN